jgi:hypothetical protein
MDTQTSTPMTADRRTNAPLIIALILGLLLIAFGARWISGAGRGTTDDAPMATSTMSETIEAQR